MNLQKPAPEKIFEYGLLYHHYANTAYPLMPNSFKEFRLKKEEGHSEFLEKEWNKADELSLYIHIPFCQVRCKFCEYVVLEGTEAETEDEYVSLLLKEMDMYKEIVKDKPIAGYDLGGGTPTKLSLDNIQKITTHLENSFNIKQDVNYSIETTPVIAANDYEKIKAVHEMGYKRISMGVQTVSERLLNELGREGTKDIYQKAVFNIRKAGYEMFNIDLMYGFLYQSDEDFENTLRYAIALGPEYITLYRNRYKGTKLEAEAGGVSLYKIIKQYQLAHKILNENGYYGNFGKNTFSKVPDDYGTSDYLTKRVIEGTPYLGIGLGAQSFGIDYLAYNQGAASKKLSEYREKLGRNLFPIQDIYSLPKEESIAKMVSVAFYFGFIDLDSFYRRFNISFTEHFKDEVKFVLEKNLMSLEDNRLILTERGSNYINGVIPLFFSNNSKIELIELYNKNKVLLRGEEEFLKAYDINYYEKPSIACDIVVFSNKSIVLIKRGEHPYMNSWALPGGFLKKGESIEETAYRELKEETGISKLLLTQLHTFSEPHRDPRGWIISNSFIGHIDSSTSLEFGEDAIDIGLFNIDLSEKKIEKNKYKIRLELIKGDIKLWTILEKTIEDLGYGTKENIKIIQSEGLAFDHAKIILKALQEKL